MTAATGHEPAERAAAVPSPSAAPTANPLLALRARSTLLPKPVANVAGTLLRPLFRQPLVVAVVGAVLALDYWLFVIDGLGGGLAQVLRDPVDLLMVVGLTVISAAQPRRPAAHRPRWSPTSTWSSCWRWPASTRSPWPRSCSWSSPSRTWRCWSNCSRSPASTATSS